MASLGGKQYLIEKLNLTKHIEGGYFSETHRSADPISTPDRVDASRSVFTSIFYLLTDDRPMNHLHRNKSDIMHYFQAGSAFSYILVTPDGELRRVKLGMDLEAGELPQLLVPGGYWKV